MRTGLPPRHRHTAARVMITDRELYKRLKAEAALAGQSIQGMNEHILRMYFDLQPGEPINRIRTQKEGP